MRLGIGTEAMGTGQPHYERLPWTICWCRVRIGRGAVEIVADGVVDACKIR